MVDTNSIMAHHDAVNKGEETISSTYDAPRARVVKCTGRQAKLTRRSAPTQHKKHLKPESYE
jgi:hypothetical protein